MHVPDGFIDAPVSAAAGVVAAGAVAVSLRGARRELAAAAGPFGGAAGQLAARAGRSADAEGPEGAGAPGAPGADRTAPLAGLVAAFVFAVQMLNFPVAAGTSGHLLGGALAAILVGPCTGLLCITVVLLMQGVLFADGGLTALGVNITDMGVTTVLVAYGVFRLLLRVLPRRRSTVTGASFVAALVSVPAAAVVFTLLYALGGTADVSLGKVFTAMVGVHVLIGVGEAAITALTVGAVVAVRPDLVYGARDVTAARLELRTVTVARPGAPQSPLPGAESEPEPEPEPVRAGVPEPEPAVAAAASDGSPAGSGSGAKSPSAHRRSPLRLWLAGLVVALVCAGVVSFYASASPDGLEKVAADHGIAKKERDTAVKDSPLADYGVRNISDARLSGGLAGVIGVGVTLAAGTGVFVVLRRRRPAQTAAASAGAAHADAAATRTEHGAGRRADG